MRRRPGTLIPLEIAILEAGLDLRGGGAREFHGFLLAKHIRDGEGARRLTAHGTLYRSEPGCWRAAGRTRRPPPMKPGHCGGCIG